MYQEWMDGVPIFIKGCYLYNIAEAQKAVKYYEKLGLEDIANSYEQYIKEQQLEMNKSSKLKRVLSFIWEVMKDEK